LPRYRPEIANTVERSKVRDRAVECSVDKLQILDVSNGSIYSTPTGCAHHTGRRIDCDNMNSRSL
jgi:hypothetical protein